ncbi:MAG TPA: nucleoside deaminase [Ghiorsea sp.]|nr:nucleoside deaminase [Ghiorsea sp.]HIP06719.1 nucleoside deaminase [Mariprofundaceae bacterium]
MGFTIKLAQQNIKQQTGGPFGAAIFDLKNHQLLAVGVNIVVPSHNSTNHAEMTAIILAQASLQTFNLAEHGDFELLTSCEPCAMCFGAVPWSGIKHLAYAATSTDAESIGFDEGAKHPDWIAELKKRGINVTPEILRDKAAQVLKDYQQQSGTIYNG